MKEVLYLLAIIVAFVLIVVAIKSLINNHQKKIEKKKEEEKGKKTYKEQQEKEKIRIGKIDEISKKESLSAEDFLFLSKKIETFEISENLKKLILKTNLIELFVEISTIKKQTRFNKYDCANVFGFLEYLFDKNYNDSFLGELIENINYYLIEIEKIEKEGYKGAKELKKIIEENCSNIILSQIKK